MANDQTMRLRSNVYNQNVTKRGNVSDSLKGKPNKYPVGVCMMGIFLFLTLGGAIFGIINAATKGSPF